MMAVYVDILMEFGWILRGRPTKSCHMFSPNLDELHDLARRIGMKRLWFQEHGGIPHYDLTPSKRAEAIAAGAVEVDHRELVEFMRIIHAQMKELTCKTP